MADWIGGEDHSLGLVFHRPILAEKQEPCWPDPNKFDGRCSWTARVG
jgi:hypothetical protein